jgi:16S rRNA (uracil1498-N3)-methyltransferase
VELSADESRHLRDVLRLGAGDEASVFDGRGREFLCRIARVDKRSSSVEVLREIQPSSPESPLELTVAATVMPGDKYDLIVQKSVELGVSSLIPMTTLRCEVKAGDAQRRVDRWRRIALEATKQCGRARLMEVTDAREFSAVVAANKAVVMFSEREGSAFDSLPGVAERLTILYGPKGGWDDLELASARERGADVITLGGRILRAETAAIAITAILQHRFGDMN